MKSIETYQIKVNRITSEKEKLIPYIKYIKNDYPQLNKVVPKNSILFKVKYKPEIVINEYHQTSNNYNTNINIKTNPNNNIHNNFNFNIKLNNDPKNAYNIDNNNGIYLSEKSTKKIGNNIIENNLIKKEKLKNEYYITTNKNQNIFDSKEIKINQYNYGKLDINNYIYTNENNNMNNNNNYLFSNSKFSNKTIEVHKNKKNEINNRKISNTVKYNKYLKQKQLSMDLINLYSRMNTESSEISLESLNNKGNKINKIIFLSGKKIKNLKEKININNNNYINNYNNKDETTIKMEIYRIKLVKEFLKHFINFYKSYIKKYYDYFFDEIKNKKQIIHTKIINNYFTHRAKNPSFILGQNKNNSIGKDLDKNENTFLKSSTSIDYYKVNNEPIKKKISNLENKNIIKNQFNDKYIFHNRMSLYKLSSNIKNNYRNTTPRINKNENNLSSIKKRIKENKSPSFQIGNRKIINRDISFGKENMEENELYRDSKELNKKYEQIQRRRKKNNFVNQNMGMISNRSVDNYKNIQFDLSNEFNEIKKYIQGLKKDNVNSNRNTINNERNKNKKNNNDDNDGLKENKEKINKIMNNKNINIKNEKNYRIRNINGKKYKIMKVNINRNLIKNNEKNNSYRNNHKKNNILNYKESNITQYNKNNIYYSKKIKKENELYSIIVKNIITKDNKIHICIHYYFLKERKKPLKQRYNVLKQSNNCSLSIINNIKKEKNNDSNIKVKLSSIKEEEPSVQNSKIYDEIDIKTFENIKNIKQFIEKVYNIFINNYKKKLINKIKTIELIFKLNNVINNKKKEDENNSFEDEIEENNISNKEKPKDNLNNNLNNNANNINAKVYSKKIGFRLNKKEGNKNSVLNNNKNNFEAFERRIYKLRYKLINYCLYLNKGSIKD